MVTWERDSGASLSLCRRNLQNSKVKRVPLQTLETVSYTHLNPIMDGDEMEKQYRISVICQQEAERDVRLLLINSNPCKTLYLNHLESCDVVGNKVEIIAGYCSCLLYTSRCV